MSNSDLRRSAKLSLKGFWFKNALIVILVFVISGIFDTVFKEEIENSDFMLLLSTLYMFFISLPISSLLILFFLQLSRNQVWKLNSFTEMAGKVGYGKLVLINFLQSIYLFLWTLLLIIPGIIKMYSYSMTYYILYDNPGYSANTAITASREMMDGNKEKLFLLDLFFFLLYLLSVVTLFIVAPWIYQYHIMTRAKFYEEIKYSLEQ